MIEVTRSMPGFRSLWRRRAILRLARALALSLPAR
jgi:hypothetical protein